MMLNIINAKSMPINMKSMLNKCDAIYIFNLVLATVILIVNLFNPSILNCQFWSLPFNPLFVVVLQIWLLPKSNTVPNN